MSRIQRFSSVYIDSEDRIRLTGKTDDDAVLGCMLTMRLLRRLVPHLLKTLELEETREVASVATAQTRQETAASSASNELAQGMAQLRAQSAIKPESPVNLPESEPPWLAHAVDIAANEQQVLRTFRDGNEASLQVQLDGTQLRQWLGILFHLWVKAEWPTDLWPEWIKSESLDSKQKGDTVH